LTIAQLADALGIPEKTLRKRLERARRAGRAIPTRQGRVANAGTYDVDEMADFTRDSPPLGRPRSPRTKD